LSTSPVFELVQRESGLWAILQRTGRTAIVVETGHVDRNLAGLDLDSWRSSRQLSEIGQGWLRVAERLAANTRSGRFRKRGVVPPTQTFTKTEALHLLLAQNYRCAVSGSYFTHDAFDTPTGPFQPSVDRIDSLLGYEPGNLRIVCLLVNLAMSTWGEDPLHKIAQRIAAGEAPGLRPDLSFSATSPARRLRLIPCDETAFPANDASPAVDGTVSHSLARCAVGNTDPLISKGPEAP
jgi:hypothetical protein